MLIPEYSNAFKKDLVKAMRRNKDITKLITITSMLIGEVPLPAQFENHPLKGNYAGHMDCHIEPDWILIYRTEENCIRFVRIGTHSDLF